MGLEERKVIPGTTHGTNRHTMVDTAPPSYENSVVIPPITTTEVSTQQQRPAEHVGMQKNEKNMNTFTAAHALVMSALFFAYGLDSSLRTDKNFEYDPFGAMMAAGVTNVIAFVIAVWRHAYNVSKKDAESFVYTNGIAGLGVWIYMITILDSSDSAHLKADYTDVYTLMLASVIISGTMIGITIVVLCLICCLLACGM